MEKHSNTWIFQGKPEIWDVSGGVKALQNTNWSVRQHEKDIQSGDRAFIWESGKNAGIVSLATVTSRPGYYEDNEQDLKHYPDGPPPEFQGKQLRVLITIDKTLKSRIYKTELLAHPVLKNLNILRNPRGTNFSVTTEQADALMSLLRNR